MLINGHISCHHVVVSMTGERTWNIGGMPLIGATELLWWKPASVSLRRPQTSHYGRSEIEPRPPWWRPGSLGLVMTPIKGQVTLYRPWQALRFPEGWGYHFSRQLAHGSGKAVRHGTGSLYTPRKYSWFSFLLGAESTAGPYCYINEKFQWHRRESNPPPCGLECSMASIQI